MKEANLQELLQARIIDLEVKVSYADDLLEQLNMTIYRQQEKIDWLINEVRQLRQQVPAPEQGTSRSLRDELPPHY